MCMYWFDQEFGGSNYKFALKFPRTHEYDMVVCTSYITHKLYWKNEKYKIKKITHSQVKCNLCTTV